MRDWDYKLAPYKNTEGEGHCSTTQGHCTFPGRWPNLILGDRPLSNT